MSRNALVTLFLTIVATLLAVALFVAGAIWRGRATAPPVAAAIKGSSWEPKNPMKAFCVAILLMALDGLAQSPVGSLLIVETANHRGYVRDVANTSLYATKPGPVDPVIAKNFDQDVFIGDIVSVNGKAGERDRD